MRTEICRRPSGRSEWDISKRGLSVVPTNDNYIGGEFAVLPNRFATALAFGQRRLLASTIVRFLPMVLIDHHVVRIGFGLLFLLLHGWPEYLGP
jgi:hypothetical protein